MDPSASDFRKTVATQKNLENAHEHLRTLISNTEKGGYLHNAIRDLQVLDHSELMALPNCYYLQALAEVRENNLIQ